MKIRIVLVEPEGEINVGFVARVMKNFGFYDLALVKPKIKVEEAIQYASHGADVLKKANVYEDIEEAIRGFSLVVTTSSKVSLGEDLLRIPITVRDFAEKISKIKNGKIAILFGRESVGLTRDEILRSHVLVTIPASEEYPSLNLSHAVAIVLYEIFGELYKMKSQVKTFEQPKPKEMEALLGNIDKAVEALKMPKHKEEKTKLVLKRIIGRALISRHEAYVLSGFFRKVHVLLSGKH